MRAVVFHDRGHIEVEDMPEPEPSPLELTLDVTAVGVCGTDASEYSHGPSMFPIHRAHPVTGHLGPMIPGHEFGGTVVAVGEAVEGFSVGDVVACGAGISCGECRQCRAGMTNVCTRYATVGLSRHGALAEQVTAPASICIEVASMGLGSDTAALVQPMAIAHHAFRRGRPGAGQPVVIVGVGGIGTFLVHVAAELGSPVVAVDIDTARLDTARAMGATRVAHPDDLGDVIDDLGDLPVVYEATGNFAGFDATWEALPTGVRLVVVGIHRGPHPLDLPALTVGEREVIGTNAHTAAVDLPAAARLVADKDWSQVAPTVFPLESLVEEALDPMAEGQPRRIKTLFDPWAESPRPLGP